MLQSAVDNGLNPEKYLKWVLEKLSSEGLKDSVMDEAVPYSENLPADLYVKKKGALKFCEVWTLTSNTVG